MRIDPDGINLGWFAVDRDGHLGFFTSQGSRVVPESVLASRETWEFLNNAIQSLPRIGKGSPPWYRFVDGKLKQWIDMAARGLYAYDFKSHDNNVFEKGDYSLIATPSRAMTLDRLDEDIGRVHSVLTMKTLSFAKKKLVEQDFIRVL